ncbi:MAG TPA: hypothetical protein VKC17_04390 [Sphingomicrobium sp.]|nr:hypothetical protein [Sphingomicrobium sp.]
MPAPGPVWQRRRERAYVANPSTAPTRFATTCAALGGTTMLRDLMPDVVAVNFGSLTQEICDRLNRRGWTAVQTGDWQGELVMGISFAGSGRSSHSVDALTEALIAVVCEVQIAETRVW